MKYSNVMATLAVFIALGGSSYAALKLPRNSVGAKQIKNNAVTSTKVKNGSLLAADFRAGQLPQGPKGDTGAQGPKGDAGAKGDTGDRGPSDAYSVHNNGPVGMAADTGTTLATMSALPPGSYVINAKLWISTTSATTRVFTCVLQAGSDYDTSATRLQLDGTNNVTHAAIPLQVVHTTTSPFSATVTCAYDGGASLVVQAHDVKITAISVASLTSTAVTG